LKITITSSFDFDKLMKEWDTKINPTVSTLSAEDTAKQWKANIDAGVLTEDGKGLSPITIANRKGGGTLPLKDTGKLYNSIKPSKNTIKYEAYGLRHQNGYKWEEKNVIVPARKWQSPVTLSEKSFNKAYKLIKKALKAAGGKKVLFKSR